MQEARQVIPSVSARLKACRSRLEFSDARNRGVSRDNCLRGWLQLLFGMFPCFSIFFFPLLSIYVATFGKDAVRCDAMRRRQGPCVTCSCDLESSMWTARRDGGHSEVENTLSGKMRLKEKKMVLSGEKWRGLSGKVGWRPSLFVLRDLLGGGTWNKSGRVRGWVGGGQQVGYTAPGGASGRWRANRWVSSQGGWGRIQDLTGTWENLRILCPDGESIGARPG